MIKPANANFHEDMRMTIEQTNSRIKVSARINQQGRQLVGHDQSNEDIAQS
jgi:hypothetical protein